MTDVSPAWQTWIEAGLQFDGPVVWGAILVLVALMALMAMWNWIEIRHN